MQHTGTREREPMQEGRPTKTAFGVVCGAFRTLLPLWVTIILLG
jgi:hypothetical protein